MSAGGLLIEGIVVPVSGVTVLNPLDTPWCKLDPGDYALRRSNWIRQIIVHTTKGNWPQKLGQGRGPALREKVVADFWRGDPNHSAAQLAIGSDGAVACLCDLAKVAAYHATTSNDWSIGIEMYQEADGSVYEATYEATVAVVLTICQTLGIPFQIPSRVYDGSIIKRMMWGGPDMVGVFGHRDNAWDFKRATASRGQGDPGDEIYRRLAVAGAERLDFENKRDLDLWQKRQTFLNIRGAKLKVDGVCGPGTVAAMRQQGFSNGRALDGAMAA